MRETQSPGWPPGKQSPNEPEPANHNFGIKLLSRKSPEYLLYIGFLFWMVYKMHSLLSEFSTRHHQALQPHMVQPWPFFQSAWIGSHGYDVADTQWRDFVKNVVLLGPALLVYALGARAIRVYFCSDVDPMSSLLSSKKSSSAGGHPHGASSIGPRILIMYYLIVGLCFVAYLHGAPVFFMLCLVVGNYGLSKLHHVLPYRVYLVIFWAVQIGVLFMNDRYKGYKFSAVFGPIFGGGGASNPLSVLDGYTGQLRWFILFNMSTLRMIAFNYDVWEANEPGAQERRDKVAKQHHDSCVDCASMKAPCFKLRADSPRPVSDFTFVNYMAYLLYAPLYIAGPMMGFNSFMSHVYERQRTFNIKMGLRYVVRLLGLFCAITWMLHFIHLNAIRKHDEVFALMTSTEKAALMYMTLAFLWTKFSIFWKFFRLVAMIDGVESPEDMRRCFSNTVTVQSFWRDWHASFNVWIVRYMYIPMGGSKTRMISIFPIFAFIALWHDIEMHLFWWAIIMCAAFIPEMLLTVFFASKARFGWLHEKPYFRVLRALGGMCSIVFLVLANLVGYGTGTQNTSRGFAQVLSSEAMIVAVASLLFFFCSASVGVRDRDAEELEKRKLKALYGLKSGRD